MKTRLISILLGVGMIAGLSGCGLYGKYKRPDVPQEGLMGQGEAVDSLLNAPGDSSNLGSLPWKEIFTDPYLQELIDTALVRNTDLQAREWAVKQAKYSLTASKCAFIPSLGINPLNEAYAGHQMVMSDGSLVMQPASYNIPVAANWEIDLFGRLLNQKRMANATYQQQIDLQQAVHTEVVANVAMLYYQLLMFDMAKHIATTTAHGWEEMVEVTEALKEAGQANSASVNQTRGAWLDIVSRLDDIERSIVDTETAICQLLRQPYHKIPRSTSVEQILPQKLNAGVSAMLLSNRPDVRAAERDVEYYNYNVKYARAQCLPKISLNATAIFNGDFFLDFFAGLAQPLFANYKLTAQIKTAKANYEIALLNYEQKLVNAGSEVSSALRQCASARQKREVRQREVDAYAQAVEDSHLLMLNARATYLDELTARNNLYNAQSSQLNDWYEEAEGIVKLYQALGGGAN